MHRTLLTSALLLRICWSDESSRSTRHRLKVHSPDEILELAADGTISDARFAADDRPVMRREQAKSTHQSIQEASSLVSLESTEGEDEDLAEAQEVARHARSIGFADDFLEELLRHHSAGVPNIVENPDFEEGSSWSKDCPTSNYRGHADVAGTVCSTRGVWSGAAHLGGSTSGNVWSIKALTDCFKSTRGAVYQDISTLGGSSYQLDFYAIDAFGNRKELNGTSQLHIEVQSPPGSSVLDEAVALTGSAAEPVEGNWSLVGPFTFKAKDESTRIYFYAGGSACPMLDNVSVRLIDMADEFEPTEKTAPSTSSSATTSTTRTSTTTSTTESTTTTSTSTATTSTSTISTPTTKSSTAATTLPTTEFPTSVPIAPSTSTARLSVTTLAVDVALSAGAAAAAAAQSDGAKPHQQALAAAHATAAAAKGQGLNLLQQAFAAAKAAALAIQSVGLPVGTVELQCAEAGRATFFVAKSGGMAQAETAEVAGDAAVAATKSQNLQSQQMVDCIAVAVKAACRSSGLTSDQQAACGGAAAIASAEKAGLSEDDQAEAAGKAVEAVTSMKSDTTMDAWEQLSAQPSTTENPRIEELLKAVEEAKVAASAAAAAAAAASAEAAHEHHSSSAAPHGATGDGSYETEVFVTEHPTSAEKVHPAEQPFTTTTTTRWRHACPDNTRAPRGTWVVYNLSRTPILHSCLAKSLKQQVPDECCRAPGTVNLVGATFEELYYSHDYGSCVTLTFAGPLAGTSSKVQCNSDNTVTYGESCDQDCSCKFQDVYTPGCYRVSDAMPGTAWFIAVAGCDCTDQKAVVPHQFNLPPMQQNVGAADILNVGPEEAAKALNRQRQQLRAYYDQMLKDEQVMSEAVNRLASGKPIADAIFGMDTGEIPEKVTKKMLDSATKDPSSAKYAVNATVSIMGHALATLKSGKPLADAVFGGDTSHLIQPHQSTPPEAGTPGNLPLLPGRKFQGKFPDFEEKEPVEQVRFSGDFESIIGTNAEQFLEECSTKLRPVRCRDVQPGSVVVTLEGSSWADLEEAHAQFSKGLTLPSFGTLEKEGKQEKEEKEEGPKEAEATPEEQKKDLLNPDITARDQQIVQSIFDKVHEEEAEEAKEATEKVEKTLRVTQTAEENSNSQLISAAGLLICGAFAVCMYSCCKGKIAAKIKKKGGEDTEPSSPVATPAPETDPAPAPAAPAEVPAASADAA